MYKVLIVEDEEFIRKGLMYSVNWLQLNCFVAGNAGDGIEGLKLIEQIRPDIVITDIRMPFKDGLELLRDSKEIYDYEAIIISGYSDFEYAKQAITLSVTDYLLKPINLDMLYETIRKLTAKIADKKMIKTYKEYFSELSLYSEILNIQHYVSRNNKTEYIRSMLEYIKKHYHEKISIQDLADQLQVSTVHLNTLFKEETKYTFHDFLTRYRVIKAIEHLKQGEKLIYEIAEEVGFQDYKYFSQVFKKYVGIPPTTFMENLRKKYS